MRRLGLVIAIATIMLATLPAESYSQPRAGTTGTTASHAAARFNGVTIDNLARLSRTIDSLRRLRQRPWTRLVLNLRRGRPAAIGPYADAAARLAAIGPVMAELVDSSALRNITVRQLARRTSAYVNAMHDDVSVWEIGNEVNGDWTGRPDSVARKVATAYRLVTGSGGRTALTLYENRGCGDGSAELGPVAWSRHYLPRPIRHHLDEVLLSYYEPQCHGIRPDARQWTSRFRALYRAFPHALLGFGEVGLPHPATYATRDRARSVIRYYCRLRVPLPYFIGGDFYWYYVEDMTPWRQAPLWHTLNQSLPG